MICDPTWAVTKRPDLGCSCTLIQTNRTVDSANTLIFHLKTLRSTARWGVLPIKGMLERSTQHGWVTRPLGHATWVLYILHEYRGAICYLLHVLFIVINSTLWISVQGEKNNPKKLRAMYGTHCYWERTNKKVSKTPPNKRQARAKERNGENKAGAAMSIFIFQLSCIQLPAKGFSCDRKGCKILKRDMVGLQLFSGSWVRNPCPFFSWGHSSSPGDGKPLSQRVVLLLQTLMLNCHNSNLDAQAAATPSPFPPLSPHSDCSPGSSHVTKSISGHSTQEKQSASSRHCWLWPGPWADLTQEQPQKKIELCVSVHVCTHTCLLFYFFVQLELIRNDKHCLFPESSSGGMKYAS